jgi:hypothetical protein
MAIAKDKGAIKKYSGGSLWYQECSDAGVVGTGVAWATFGYLQESKLSDTTEEEAVNDETGGQVASLEGNRKVVFSGLFMQTDKDHIDFLKETVRGKFYHIYHSQGLVNGTAQEMLYGICTIKPQVEIASGVKRIPFEFTVLKNESALTSVATTGITGVTAATITVPAGQYYAVAGGGL